MATISPIGKSYYYDANGNPLNGGKVFTYEAGTTTPKVTYTTQDETTANANPVILDSDGSADIWLGDGGYKFVVTDSADVEIFTTDNLGGGSSAAFGANVNTLTTNTPITDLYANSVNICTSAITLSLLSVAVAGEGFYFTVRNNTSGNITIDPDGSETIDGQATLEIGEGFSAIIICDGSSWTSLFLDSVLDINALAAATITASDEIIFSDVDDSNINKKDTVQGILDLIPQASTSTLGLVEKATVGEMAAGGVNKFPDAKEVKDYVDAEVLTSQIQLQSSVATTSGTSIDFTSIPSGVKRICINFMGVSLSGTDSFLVQIGDSGGVETTGYLGTGGTLAGASTGSTTSTAGFIIRSALSAPRLYNGTITLNLSDTNEWCATGMFGDDVAALCFTGGNKTLSAELDRVRVTSVGGTDTFDAGSMSISWEF